MAPKQSLLVKICDSITNISIYVLLFLMPIFFLPFTADVLDFNKQALLSVLMFVAFFSWLVKNVFSRKFNFNYNKVHIAALGLFLTYVLATVFSVFNAGSFWGWPSNIAESLVTVIGFFLLYFLVSNTFGETQIRTSLTVFSISFFIALVYGILQMFGVHVIWWGFANNNAFNTVGSWGSFGLFTAVLLPLFLTLTVISKMWWRAFFLVNIVLIFAVLLLINFAFLWWTVLLAMALMIFFWMIRRDVFDSRWMFLPIFFFIISLFFITLHPQLPGLPQQTPEVGLSNKANLEVDVKALKVAPLTGSGPGTFGYDFAKFKDESFNNSTLWNFNFENGSSKILTNTATHGLLWLLAFLVFVGMGIFYGARFLIFGSPALKSVSALEPPTSPRVALTLGFTVMLCAQLLGNFLYNSNVVLDCMFFFGAGALVALVFANNRTHVFKQSSLLNLGITLAFATVLIFGVGFLMLDGQRYLANGYYSQGLKSVNNGDLDWALTHTKTAANNAKVDTYFNQIALLSLAKLQQLAGAPSGSLTEAQKQQVQVLVSDAVNASNISVSLNSNSVDNWMVQGNVCQSLMGLVDNAKDCALKAYDQAEALNPINPFLYSQQGNVYLSSTQSLGPAEAQALGEALAQAKEKLQKAIELKKDYALAYLQLALVERLQQNVGAESVALENAVLYAGNDAGTLFQIGLVHFEDQNWVKAQAQFERALGLVPNYANALYYLGLSYDKQGKKDDAVAAISLLLRLNPNNQNVQRILSNLTAGRPALDGLVPVPPVTDEKSKVEPIKISK